MKPLKKITNGQRIKGLFLLFAFLISCSTQRTAIRVVDRRTAADTSDAPATFSFGLDCSKFKKVDFFDLCVATSHATPTSEEAVCAIQDPAFDPYFFKVFTVLNNGIVKDKVSTFYCANYSNDARVISSLLSHPKINFANDRKILDSEPRFNFEGSPFEAFWLNLMAAKII